MRDYIPAKPLYLGAVMLDGKLFSWRMKVVRFPVTAALVDAIFYPASLILSG
jgi:hypothetical protein